MKHLEIKEEILGAYLDLYFNCTKDELELALKKKLKDKNLALPKDNTAGSTFVLRKNTTYYRIIWIDRFDWSVRSQSLLVHELVHFMTQLFEDKGIPIGRKEDEVMAYYMEYLVRTIFWKLRKLNPVYKNKK